jgi:hypothetical protein
MSVRSTRKPKHTSIHTCIRIYMYIHTYTEIYMHFSQNEQTRNHTSLYDLRSHPPRPPPTDPHFYNQLIYGKGALDKASSTKRTCTPRRTDPFKHPGTSDPKVCLAYTRIDRCSSVVLCRISWGQKAQRIQSKVLGTEFDRGASARR